MRRLHNWMVRYGMFGMTLGFLGLSDLEIRLGISNLLSSGFSQIFGLWFQNIFSYFLNVPSVSTSSTST